LQLVGLRAAVIHRRPALRGVVLETNAVFVEYFISRNV
jgi:hypothetical protein